MKGQKSSIRRNSSTPKLYLAPKCLQSAAQSSSIACIYNVNECGIPQDSNSLCLLFRNPIFTLTYRLMLSFHPNTSCNLLCNPNTIISDPRADAFPIACDLLFSTPLSVRFQTPFEKMNKTLSYHI